MNDAPVCVQATALTKRFVVRRQELAAFENINFSIRQGEFCAVVGPSGCGKTTLMRVLAGLEPPSSGTLEVMFGRNASSRDMDLSFVFQEGGLFPWMSLRQNIGFLLQEKFGDSAAERFAKSWLKKLELEPFAHYFPHQVSGGMRQRVALARSFALQPALLLMDEPFVFTDDFTRSRLHVELELLWREANNTVVFVTHDIEEAVLLADRVFVFSAHPGSITHDINVDLERPRARAQLRENARFNGLVKEITKLIHAA